MEYLQEKASPTPQVGLGLGVQAGAGPWERGLPCKIRKKNDHAGKSGAPGREGKGTAGRDAAWVVERELRALRGTATQKGLWEEKN